MSYFAQGVHNVLTKQHNIDPRSEEYYEKIDKRMREVFPNKFEQKKKQTNVVAPATRSSTPKKVRLTGTQVALAKKLGVPLDLYAQQVVEEMRKANG